MTKTHRILVLTGPAGSGKTATVRVLSKALSIGILEWQHPVTALASDTEKRSAFGHFIDFLTRALRYPGLATTQDSNEVRCLILIEDVPSLNYPEHRRRFHELLRRSVRTGGAISVPLVFVVSDVQFGRSSLLEMLPRDVLHGACTHIS